MEGVLEAFAKVRTGSVTAMMYYLHLLSEEIKGFNVFSYVTFRAIAAAVTAFVLSLVFGHFVIRKLIALKAGQPIRTRMKCIGWLNYMAQSKACRRWAAFS